MTLTKGISTRRTRSGILVARVHYTADPERDSNWARSERLKDSSQAAWDCEQEIVHEATADRGWQSGNVSFRSREKYFP
jgi:hypothetical protein